MKKLIPFLILIFGQLLIVSSQSDLYNTYRIDEYIDKLEYLRSIEDEDTVCKTEFMLWREHLRDLSMALIITKKERRKFLKYFKAGIIYYKEKEELYLEHLTTCQLHGRLLEFFEYA